MKLPLVSILMPVYNNEATVERAVLSILNQTLQDFEFIIIDDGSTDKSLEIIEKIFDSRIHIVKNKENLGLPYRLNQGLAIARGKYIARMDSDDVSAEERLQIQTDHLAKNPDVLLVGSYYNQFQDGKFVGIRKQVAAYENLKIKLFFGNNIAHPSVVFNARLLKATQLNYNVEYLVAQDYEFWTRLIPDHRIENIRLPLIDYHKYSAPRSNRSNDRQLFFQKANMNYILAMFGNIKEAALFQTFFTDPGKMGFIQKAKAMVKILAGAKKIKKANHFYLLLRCLNQFKYYETK